MERMMRVYTQINAACTRASIRAMAMQARNMDCMMRKQRPVYLEKDFTNLVVEEGVGYNEVISQIYG